MTTAFPHEPYQHHAPEREPEPLVPTVSAEPVTAEPEQQDLEDRQALRRVASLSTELEDISEVEYRRLRLERVVLVGVWTGASPTDAENSLVELKLLAETAGSQVLDAMLQRR